MLEVYGYTILRIWFGWDKHSGRFGKCVCLYLAWGMF